MRFLKAFIVVLILLGAGVIAFAWSGIYNIAATEPHWGVTRDLIETVRDRSVAVRSRDLKPPNKDAAQSGVETVIHYQETCLTCHGGPGLEPAEFASGLNPQPPELASEDALNDRSKAQVYWIIKHGLKMTGMPAQGPSHGDELMWRLADLVLKLSDMSPQEYEQRVRAGRMEGKAGEERAHEHEPPQETPDSGRSHEDHGEPGHEE
jgi:cytochrome c5